MLEQLPTDVVLYLVTISWNVAFSAIFSLFDNSVNSLVCVLITKFSGVKRMYCYLDTVNITLGGKQNIEQSKIYHEYIPY